MALTRMETTKVETGPDSYLAIALQKFSQKFSEKIITLGPRRPALVVLKRGKLSGRATDAKRKKQLKLLTRRSRVQVPSRAHFSFFLLEGEQI